MSQATSTRRLNQVVLGYEVVAAKADDDLVKAKTISRTFHSREAAVAFRGQAVKTGQFGKVWVREKLGFDDI